MPTYLYWYNPSEERGILENMEQLEGHPIKAIALANERGRTRANTWLEAKVKLGFDLSEDQRYMLEQQRRILGESWVDHD